MLRWDSWSGHFSYSRRLQVISNRSKTRRVLPGPHNSSWWVSAPAALRGSPSPHCCLRAADLPITVACVSPPNVEFPAYVEVQFVYSLAGLPMSCSCHTCQLRLPLMRVPVGSLAIPGALSLTRNPVSPKSHIFGYLDTHVNLAAHLGQGCVNLKACWSLTLLEPCNASNSKLTPAQ